jgi:peptidoglycan-associated lipoprotein
VHGRRGECTAGDEQRRSREARCRPCRRARQPINPADVRNGAVAQRLWKDAFGDGANASDRVYFAYDRAELTAEGQSVLQRQAEWLRRYSNVTVTLEGHADERGTREYNLALGDRRAATVKRYLEAAGIAPARMQSDTYGKERPADAGSFEDSYAKNRRAVTAVD